MGRQKEESFFALFLAELQKIQYTFSVESCRVVSSFLNRPKGENGVLHSAIIHAQHIHGPFLNARLLEQRPKIAT